MVALVALCQDDYIDAVCPGTSHDHPPPARSLRILIFNDSPRMLATLERWFDMHGHGVRSVRLSELRNAYEDCIALIGAYRPHAIVFDVGLSYAPNWDFVQALRQTVSLQRYPFIVTTPDRSMLEELVEEPTDAIQLVGKEGELVEILEAVVRATEAPAG
jgi:CheY-like chemotaxis protein